MLEDVRSRNVRVARSDGLHGVPSGHGGERWRVHAVQCGDVLAAGRSGVLSVCRGDVVVRRSRLVLEDVRSRNVLIARSAGLRGVPGRHGGERWRVHAVQCGDVLAVGRSGVPSLCRGHVLIGRSRVVLEDVRSRNVRVARRAGLRGVPSGHGGERWRVHAVQCGDVLAAGRSGVLSLCRGDVVVRRSGVVHAETLIQIGPRFLFGAGM